MGKSGNYTDAFLAGAFDLAAFSAQKMQRFFGKIPFPGRMFR